MNEFLPVSLDDLKRRGIRELDFVLVSGDAYVDHPSFGAALIGRWLEARGYTVGIIAQPDWTSAAAFRVLGRPRLGFLVTSGNLDSMVRKYTAARKPRSDDAYSPGKKAGLVPDRAVIAYSIKIREAFGKIPIVLGGLEASLRRLGHYDYWSDKVRASVLVDSAADLIVYGMGERAILEIADRLSKGEQAAAIRDVRGTVWRAGRDEELPGALRLPDYESVRTDTRVFAESFRVQYANNDPHTAQTLVEAYPKCRVVQNPPAFALSQEELDSVYALPFARTWHPSYDATGGISGIEEVKFSVASVRGCYGSCSFCSLTSHQGRATSARSHESVLAEARLLAADPDFKGYIHDVGGPTANFRMSPCAKADKKGVCVEKDCIGYESCRNLVVDHSEYLELLRKLKKIPGVKKVFIRSGIRFDYLLADADSSFFEELVRDHVSGQLKVAPEHASDRVLRLMNKPPFRVYEEFRRRFTAQNEREGKKQFLVPYFISSHPGSDLDAAIELALYFKRERSVPEQVQDFYPTPATLSTCMYHTGLDPITMKPVFVPKSPEEKAMQRALLQFSHPKHHALVRKALRAAGRTDLIGYGPACLVPPDRREGGYKGGKRRPSGSEGATSGSTGGPRRGAEDARPEKKLRIPSGTGNRGRGGRTHEDKGIDRGRGKPSGRPARPTRKDARPTRKDARPTRKDARPTRKPDDQQDGPNRPLGQRRRRPKKPGDGTRGKT